MRSRWLSVWYALLIFLAVEIMAYGLAGIAVNLYRSSVWRNFNAGVREMREVDEKTPYAEYINRYAREQGVSPAIVAAVMQAESSFQPRALSPSGAYGLMQVIPGTWRQVNQQLKVCSSRHAGDCTVECYYDPELNTRIGTAYLGQLNQQFAGDMVLALAAYNAGPGAVEAYGGIPPYEETQSYVQRVIGYWYQTVGKGLPADSGYAGQWESIQAGLGWLTVMTVGLAVLAGRRLYRSAGSWRWR